VIHTALSDLVKSLESGARPKGGVTSDTGEIPSVGGEHLNEDGGFRFENLKRIPRSFFDEMKSGHICRNDILIVKDGATTGKTSFVGDNFPFQEAAVNEHVFAIRMDAAKADPRYVFFFLTSPHGHAQVLSDFRGATVGGIGRTFIDKVMVPLPPLDEQRRIAAILHQADDLRRKRREAIDLLDKLRYALFSFMFGDLVQNEMGWDRQEFGFVIDKIDSGWSPRCLDRPATEDEWGVLKLSAVTWCEYDDAEQKALPIDKAPRPNIEVTTGDILFTRKNTRDLLAACALVTKTRPRLMLSDLIYRIRLKSDAQIDPVFLHALLTRPSKRRAIQALAGGSAGSMPNISKEKLRAADIEIPPLDLQQTFAARAAEINKLKAQHRAHLSKLDALFASLQHRAFQGKP
jgi:type I restriction enzyme S subunit